MRTRAIRAGPNAYGKKVWELILEDKGVVDEVPE